MDLCKKELNHWLVSVNYAMAGRQGQSFQNTRLSTRLYHKTGDLHLVQRALGHRQITTTGIYARVSDDWLVGQWGSLIRWQAPNCHSPSLGARSVILAVAAAARLLRGARRDSFTSN